MKLFTTRSNVLASTAISAVLLAGVAPAAVQADEHGYYNDFERLTIYFTRHAEKETVQIKVGDSNEYTTGMDNTDFIDLGIVSGSKKQGRFDNVCNDDKCAEQLSAQGLVRAELLAEWFEKRGITNKLDAVYATHKTRTQQTVAPTAARVDILEGQVIQLPAMNDDGSPATELNPQSTTPSECATLYAINEARMNGLDTILIAGHSGTLYDIMGAGNSECLGLGLDTSNEDRFPKDAKGKVRDFGDLWKIVIKRDGEVQFKWRKALNQPERLKTTDTAH